VKKMGKLIGFHEPKHILKMREEQAKKTGYLGQDLDKVDIKPCKRKSRRTEKKAEEKKFTELNDEDMEAYGYKEKE